MTTMAVAEAPLGAGSETEWAVETHGLTKRFGDNVAVNDVELLVPRGCAFGYLGPNGAGKTTLIRVLLGLTHADAGTMSLLGYEVPRHRDLALARVGAIVDEPRFHGHLTGRQNLQILAAAREPAARQRIEPALERVGIAHRADDRVAKYSMGMRQRLGVAACLLGDPQLLILDEPMNGLDPAGMHEMRDMIRRSSPRAAPSCSPRTCSTRSSGPATPSPSSTGARSSARARSPTCSRARRYELQVDCADPERARARPRRHAVRRPPPRSAPTGSRSRSPAGTERDAVAEVNRRPRRGRHRRLPAAGDPGLARVVVLGSHEPPGGPE